MKYALLALALITVIPGCSCLRKKDKSKKETTKTMQDKGGVKKSADTTMKKSPSAAKEHMDSTTKRY